MDDNLDPAWERLAVALSRSGGDDAAPPGDVPTGWEDLARSLRPAPAPERAQTPAYRVRDVPDAPAGWQTLATALRAPEAPTEPPLDEPVEQVAAAPVDEVAAEPVDEVAAGELPRPQRRPALPGLSGLAGSWTARAAVAVVVAGALAAVLIFVVFPGGSSRVPKGDVFVVDGRPTTTAAYNAEVKVLEEVYGVKAPATSNAAKYAAFKATTAKALAAQVLFGRIAGQKGISVPQKQASDRLDTVVQNDYSGSQSDFDSALSSAGLTRNEVLTQVTDQLLQGQLFDKVVGTPTVTAAEEQATYNRDRSTLGTSESRAISYIVVSSKSKASSIIAQLHRGASFATLAKTDSLDKTTKSKGGALGTVTKADLSSAFGDAAFSATLDRPFGPVSDGGDYYVGEVTKVTPATSPSYDSATKTAIHDYLVDKADVATWDAWLRRQLVKADIAYAAAYRPAHPDSPPTITVPSVATFLADQSSSPSSSSTSPAPAAP